MNIRDVMRGRWTDALIQNGIDEHLLTGKHCKCPLCGGKDRFRYTDKDGDGRYFCNGCGAGDGMTLLMKVTGREFKDLAKELEPSKFKTMERKVVDHSGLIEKIKAKMVPVEDGDLVCRYLASRGISRFDFRWVKYVPDAYQWVTKERLPAMVVAMRDLTGAVKGYHLTFLNLDGTKHSRLYTPGETGDCTIWLSKPGTIISLAEGIETAMSVSHMTKQTCWATGDAGRMERFVVPAGVEGVQIWADNDENFAGQSAAYALANRLALKGYRVEVHVPDIPGFDYNNIWRSTL